MCWTFFTKVRIGAAIQENKGTWIVCFNAFYRKSSFEIMKVFSNSREQEDDEKEVE